MVRENLKMQRRNWLRKCKTYKIGKYKIYSNKMVWEIQASNNKMVQEYLILQE